VNVWDLPSFKNHSLSPNLWITIRNFFIAVWVCQAQDETASNAALSSQNTAQANELMKKANALVRAVYQPLWSQPGLVGSSCATGRGSASAGFG
jgi:hypothetical protein